MSITKVVTQGVDVSISWKEDFPIESENNGSTPRVYLGGHIVKDSQDGKVLIAAGSTRGMGFGYGDAEGDDEDGYISVLDPETGQVQNQRRIGSDQDDVIMGICDDPEDVHSFYVVGGTRGVMGAEGSDLEIKDGSMQAWISKMNVKTLEAQWTVQWGAQSNDPESEAYASDCIASKGGVYVAGSVLFGGRMVYGSKLLNSKGGNDIWVARLEDQGAKYDVSWMEQLGTAGDESLARYGSIVATRDGAAIAYGYTTGPMFRDRKVDPDISDIFVMRLDRHEFVPPKPAPPRPAPSNPTAAPQVQKEKNGSFGKTLGILIVIVLLLAFSYCIISRKNQERKLEAQKTGIFFYLQKFDVEDVDLRKSPPGGWHGTYLNKLAYGVGAHDSADTGDVSSFESSPLTTPSTVSRNSLFSDSASSPTYGETSNTREII